MNALLIYGSPAKGICLVQERGGNSVAFLMEHEHFIQKLYVILQEYNIEIEETELTDAEKQIQIFRKYVLGFKFANYFHQTL
jgi:DNA primase